MAWLTGWNYRKSHTINHAAGSGTSYQVRFKVHYGSGTASGEDVYCYSKCRTDFGDVRFCHSDGSTLLPYWMEEETNGDYAVFWAKVTEDLSNEDRIIYLYFGMSDASTASNGDSTFLLFDHFDDGSINTSKWNESGTGTAVESGTELTVTAGGTPYDAKTIASDLPYAVGVAVESRVKAATTTVGGLGVGMTGVPNSLQSRDYTLAFRVLYSDANFSWVSGDGTNYNAGFFSSTKDTSYHRCSTRRTGSDDKLFLGSEENSGTEYPTSANRKVAFTAYNVGGAGVLVADWVAVRKFVNPEPAHGAWGDAELFATDSLSLSDAVLRNRPFLSVTDTFGLAESTLRHKTLLPITESVNLAEVLRALKTLNVPDGLTLADASSTPSRILRVLESAALADAMAVSKTLQITDEVILVEVVELGVGGAKKTKLFLMLGDLAVQLTDE
ncbi:MAG: DUF2341 domain-containing protein [Candidatus Bathyarchaeia archaeon]